MQGRVVIITGAEGGLGRAETVLFRERGAQVICADLAVERPAESSDEVVWEQLDVTDADAWARVVDRTLERFGRVDVLVNNAGVAQRSGVIDTDPEEWDRVLDVNARGTWLGMRAVAPTMILPPEVGFDLIYNGAAQLATGETTGEELMAKVQAAMEEATG